MNNKPVSAGCQVQPHALMGRGDVGVCFTLRAGGVPGPNVDTESSGDCPAGRLMAAAHQADSRPLRDRQPCKFPSRVLEPEKYIKWWTDEGHVARAMEIGALGCGTTDLQVLLMPSICLDVDGSLALSAGSWGCC